MVGQGEGGGVSDPRSKPPAPVSVSAQAQAYLSTTNPYGGDGEQLPYPALDDVDGWLRYVARSDDRLMAAMSARLPPNLPLSRTEIDVDGVRTFVFRPDHVADDLSTPIYLEIHGGALIMGAGEACAAMASGSSMTRNMITWSVDYRMPPLHPYPTPLDDCLAVYRRVLAERDPSDVVVGGGSAGGNLAAALMLRARDEGLPMPAALVLLTPEVDLTESGDSFVTNNGIDHVLTPLMPVNLLYANGHDLAHPYLSPLFGDLSGFPPTFLQAGTRDLFLSNTVRMHRRLCDAGVEAELHIWEAMPHGGFGGAPEDLEIALAAAAFAETHVVRSVRSAERP